MSRYSINFDRLVNMLVPYFLRNRKYVLFLQSLVSPLQKTNSKFLDFAREKKIEASMTSQVILFTWYLNQKYQKYFVDKNDSIEIEDAIDIGVPSPMLEFPYTEKKIQTLRLARYGTLMILGILS